MANPDAENSQRPSRHPKFSGALTFAFVAVLWVGLGFGAKYAWAVCSPFFSSNGISFLGGEQAANATYSNYDYWNYCTVYSSIADKYIPVSNFTWTDAQQTTNFKQNWICTYQGRTDNYYTANCTWLSNITAFWESAPTANLNQSVLILR